jgi:hypothetical protein
VASVDDLQRNLAFTTGGKGRTGTLTFLPEPPRVERCYLVISADDHIVEPPETFDGRVPTRLAARAPRIIEKDDGSEVEHILVESDYPHCDSTWPHTQRVLAEELAGIPDDEAELISWRNAAALFRHSVPEHVQADPNRY